MFKKVIAIGKISILTLAMTSLLAGCGTMVNLESKTPANNNEVIESKEEKTEESKETKETEEEIKETENNVGTTEEASEKTTESNLEETTENEEKYIKYEDMEPVTMYVIFYSELYADLNATEGEFVLVDDLEAGEAVNVDGKGTYEGNEYYRVVRTEDSLYPYHLIVPAKTLKPADNSETKEEELDPFFNGDGYEGTLNEIEQKYIKYTDIEPTKMYVINNSNGEQYSTYHDINVTEGYLIVSGLVEPNQELIIDGKGTYDGIEYYRIEFQAAMMLDHQIIIPVELVVAEKQETPVVSEQQPQQSTEIILPEEEPTIPEWTPDTGVSKEDWDKFFGINASSRQYNWEPDHGEDFTCEINENGGFTITGSGIDPEILEKAGNMIVY